MDAASDPVLRRITGDAINAMREAKDDAARLLEVRKCSRRLDLSLSSCGDEMGHVSNMAIDRWGSTRTMSPAL
jgi:hypothetical protein